MLVHIPPEAALERVCLDLHPAVPLSYAALGTLYACLMLHFPHI